MKYYLPKIFIAMCLACILLLSAIIVLFHVAYSQNEEIFRLKKRLIDAECYQKADSLLQKAKQRQLFENNFERGVDSEKN